MSKQLEQKKEAIIKAIQDLHADTSGPASDNLEAICHIIEEASDVRDMLERDVANDV